MKKYKISQYARKNNVVYRTVWNWVHEGKVNYEVTKNGHILVLEENPDKGDNVAIYARVSSSENKSNLDRQRERLENYCAAKGYKVVKVVTEIGSGLNDKRPKLEKLLMDDSIKRIVVEHSDRFSRFGMNYISKLLEQQGRCVEVINQQESDRDDLMQDFVSIITSFCARLYGLRRSRRRTERIIEEISKEED